MTIALNDFPAPLQAAARRTERFWGTGTPEAPYVGGWIIPTQAAAYDDALKGWLKGNGFTHGRGGWTRPDVD